MKKVPFCKLKMSLDFILFFSIYKHFGDFFRCIFTILLQVQHENNFLPTPVDTDEANLVAFWVFVCTTASLIAQISCSENVSKRDTILASVTKQ